MTAKQVCCREWWGQIVEELDGFTIRREITTRPRIESAELRKSGDRRRD
jgi:hypothetical protein